MRERGRRLLKLSQAEYIEKVLNIVDAKRVSVPLGGHFSLSKVQELKADDEKALMSNVPYASAVGILMYTIVCTRSNIAQAVKVVSRYMSNPGQEHWRAVKWIMRYLKQRNKR